MQIIFFCKKYLDVSYETLNENNTNNQILPNCIQVIKKILSFICLSCSIRF